MKTEIVLFTDGDKNIEVQVSPDKETVWLTQEEMAIRVNITRQAVSRWETGETQPNPQMLKVLSREFNVSINTLLGSPRKLFCQCCGMPLEDSLISKEANGDFNEDSEF